MSEASVKRKEIKTPELDKMAGVKDQSQPIGEFLDWLQNEKGVSLMVLHQHTDSCYNNGLSKTQFRKDYKGDRRITEGELQRGRFDRPRCYIEKDYPMPFHFTPEKLLAEFFGINLNKVEKERQALLDSLRG